MATYIGTGESLPQIVITPNKGFTREGHASGKEAPAEDRLTPAQVRNKSALSGRQAAQKAADEGGGFWSGDGFSFGDLIDIINPLQHIPIVSTVYRAITGDEIGAGPRLIGGALLGGVAGFAAAAVGAVVEGGTGKDVGGHMLTAMGVLEDEQVVTAAAKQAPKQGVTRLSSKDAVTRVSEDMELAMADTPPVAVSAPVPPPPTAEDAMRAAGLDPIALVRRQDSKERAIHALGGMEQATQRYQQVQSMNRLQNTALGMDIKG